MAFTGKIGTFKPRQTQTGGTKPSQAPSGVNVQSATVIIKPQKIDLKLTRPASFMKQQDGTIARQSANANSDIAKLDAHPTVAVYSPDEKHAIDFSKSFFRDVDYDAHLLAQAQLSFADSGSDARKTLDRVYDALIDDLSGLPQALRSALIARAEGDGQTTDAAKETYRRACRGERVPGVTVADIVGACELDQKTQKRVRDDFTARKDDATIAPLVERLATLYPHNDLSIKAQRDIEKGANERTSPLFRYGTSLIHDELAQAALRLGVGSHNGISASTAAVLQNMRNHGVDVTPEFVADCVHVMMRDPDYVKAYAQKITAVHGGTADTVEPSAVQTHSKLEMLVAARLQDEAIRQKISGAQLSQRSRTEIIDASVDEVVRGRTAWEQGRTGAPVISGGQDKVTDLLGKLETPPADARLRELAMLGSAKRVAPSANRVPTPLRTFDPVKKRVC